jgi:ABC-type sugar transport system substrate-binding protein
MRIMTDSIRRGRPRSWRRQAKLAAAVLVAGAALTACSKSAATTTSDSTAAAADSGGPVVSGGVSLAGKTVLLDIYDPESNTFFQPAVEGAKAAAAAFGLKLQRPPEGDDGTWARTLIADSSDDLERQLAEQAAHDAEFAGQR